MSVLVPDKEVFNYLAHGLNRTLYRSTMDEWYCHEIRQHFMNKNVDVELKRLVESWMQMNMLSYCIKYSHHDVKRWRCSWRERTPHKDVQIHQVLKYAKCVRYNIELDTIEDAEPVTQQMKDDEALLGKWIDGINAAIVDQMAEYKQATWSE